MEIKSHPEIGACGLDCGLCPRFHSGGASPCRGCGSPGFWERRPACAVARCCVRQHGLETCGQCSDLESCPRMARRLEFGQTRDSLLSYAPIPANLALVRAEGLPSLVSLEARKQAILLKLLAGYNDRCKGLYCLASQLLPVEELEDILKKVKRQTSSAPVKAKAAAMRAAITGAAERLGIKLVLRTKPPGGD